jgi:putative Holliday junction resolvase
VRALGLDVGDGRIGVASGDTGSSVAVPVGAVERTETHADIQAILDLARERDAELLVVGMPLSMTGKRGSQAESVALFIEGLAERTDIEIVTVDERLTTVEAERRMREPRGGGRRKPAHTRRGDVDAAAAAVILQAWLDGRR